MVVDGRTGSAAMRIPMTRTPTRRLVRAPAEVTMILCHTGLERKEFSSGESSSSPSMETNPPMGKALME